MVKFLNDKQRDPRLNEILYPLYDPKRVREIIDTYEQNEENRKNRELATYKTSSIALTRKFQMLWARMD